MMTVWLFLELEGNVRFSLQSFCAARARPCRSEDCAATPNAESPGGYATCPSYVAPPGHSCTLATRTPPIRQPPEPQNTRSLRQLGSSESEDPLHFFRRSPRYALQLCHLTGHDIRIDARDRHHLTSHFGGPSSHFAAAMSFNRCSSNAILIASSGAPFFRYRSQAHVTRERDQAQSRAESAYSSAHLQRPSAHSDPATTSRATQSPTKSGLCPDANP